ncbi:hypothetical protein ACINWC743_A0628 [Acinetobacter sp. WC-743]|nr:hypothetical protein ACINWC743_A0628 [Acinetobacter sp. WC-743]
MYHIYQIYQSEELVLTTYHTINPNCSDTTKLDIIINSPATLNSIVDSYFKQPDQFKIVTAKTNLNNALEANEYLEFLNNKPINTTIIKTINNYNNISILKKRFI